MVEEFPQTCFRLVGPFPGARFHVGEAGLFSCKKGETLARYLVNESKTLILDNRNFALPYSDIVMGLYTNSPSLSVNTVLGDLTEQNGTGYARQPCTPWGAAALQPDDKALSNGIPCVFVNTGGSPWAQVNGWFLYSPGALFLVHVGTFSVPFILAASEDKTIIPQTTLTGNDVA
jgi:hypothetical protein